MWTIDGAYYYSSTVSLSFSLAPGQNSRMVTVKLKVRDDELVWSPEITKTYTIRAGQDRHFYLKDHLGSVRVTVDEEGEPIGFDDYYPYGLQMPTRSSNTSNPNDRYKFTNNERDTEAGLTIDYFGARYYDPMLGSFYSIDRFYEKYPSLSPYQYTAGNPMIFVDVNGDSLILKGEEKDIEAFLNVANKKLGGAYSVEVDENGLISVTSNGGKLDASGKAFYDVLMGAASHDVGKVELKLGEAPLIDSFDQEILDMSDINSIVDGKYLTKAGALAHALAEQTSKQLDGSGYNLAHQIGNRAQSLVDGSQRVLGSDGFQVVLHHIVPNSKGIQIGNRTVNIYQDHLYSKGKDYGFVRFDLTHLPRKLKITNH